jgi:putative ABC transport system ATP-binding protein
MTDSVLRLSDVSKTYPGPPPVTALADATLDVAAGDLVAIVGPSGSGKSTLLNVMGALDVPTAGVVEIEGQNIAELSDRRLSSIRANRLGFIFQEFFLLSGTTAVDNVADGLLYRGVRKAERRNRAVAALERVGLGHRLEHLPSQLSGGERQRVAIARALVGDPSVVFADEPTGNLDSKTSDGIVNLLLDLNAGGSTIVVITHDRSVAERFPRRIEILDGRLSEEVPA